MNVTVYSTNSCPYCTMVKDYLRGRGISFTEHDVGNSQEKAQEMVRKSGQMGVPVVDINGRVIVGFDKGEIDKALA
ncbi:glutathione S-transferase N-terminal domain-containing protein [Treponema sp. OttesenSCG-928-L16]|nr:glutathione S-transferase N-terminal domain-containing protein [Treponema sp. OttesenSCG-928-L16]